MAQTKQVTVEAAKAAHLEKISKLSVETLAILADKAGKPGIEMKLKMFQGMI